MCHGHRRRRPPAITAGARWFERLTKGAPRCCFTPPASHPPCTNDAVVAVSNNVTDPDPDISLHCLQHLHEAITPGLSHSCSVGNNSPNLRHHAFNLQAIQRHLRLLPDDPGLNAQVTVLKNQLHRRL